MTTIESMDPTSPVRIKTKLLDAARRVARDEKRTLQGTVELALEQYLDRRRKPR